MGHHSARARARQQIRSVPRDRVAGRVLLGLDRAGLGERGGGWVDVLPGRGTYAVHRVAEVDSGRARAAELVARDLERRRIMRQLERDPIGGGDPDQGRAADRQAPDRVGDLRRRSQLELALVLRKRGLIECAERLAVEAQCDQGCGYSRFSIDSGGASATSASVVGCSDCPPSTPSACWSSPDSYISVTMSQPPTSSPSTNS